MSEKKKKKDNPATVTEAMQQVTPQMTPELAEEVNNVLSDLIANATKLSIKVAVCDCESRNECDVFNMAKKIASLVDKLQSIT